MERSAVLERNDNPTVTVVMEIPHYTITIAAPVFFLPGTSDVTTMLSGDGYGVL
jgi:hypothetical protein